MANLPPYLFAEIDRKKAIKIAEDPEYQKQSRAYWEARYFNSYYSAIRKIKPDAMLVMLFGWVYMNPAAEMRRLFPADTVAWVVPNTPIIDAALTDIPAGRPVVKYGEVIGLATQCIRAGDLVHLHNVSSSLAAPEVMP